VNIKELYHGSKVEFDKVSLSKSRDRRDFGRGFYTTTIKEQAVQWAKSLSERYGGNQYLYVFEYKPDDSLKVKSFDGLTLEWLEMVKDNRIFGGVTHDYDIVFGPVANDDTMPTIALYVDGTINAEAALIQLEYFKANDQVSFLTERSLMTLRLVETVAL
jgi:hypothetical protein